MKYWLKRHHWCVFCIFFLFLLVGIRIGLPLKENVYKECSVFYYETRFLGCYAIIYLLLLMPVMEELTLYQVVVRRGMKENCLWHVMMCVLERAGSFSFLLTIALYIINCSGCEDWLLLSNIQYIGVLFFTQMVGWLVIGTWYVIMFLLTKRKLVAFLISELLLIGLNLSLYINETKVLEKYIRMYYFMFHIETFSSYAQMFSVVAIYIMVVCILYFVAKKIYNDRDFL